MADILDVPIIFDKMPSTEIEFARKPLASIIFEGTIHGRVAPSSTGSQDLIYECEDKWGNGTRFECVPHSSQDELDIRKRNDVGGKASCGETGGSGAIRVVHNSRSALRRLRFGADDESHVGGEKGRQRDILDYNGPENDSDDGGGSGGGLMGPKGPKDPRGGGARYPPRPPRRGYREDEAYESEDGGGGSEGGASQD
jgi:hypothetical protein